MSTIRNILRFFNPRFRVPVQMTDGRIALVRRIDLWRGLFPGHKRLDSLLKIMADDLYRLPYRVERRDGGDATNRRH